VSVGRLARRSKRLMGRSSLVVRNRSHRALLTCMSRVLVVNDDGIHAPGLRRVAVPDSVPGLCNLPRPLPAMARAWVNGLKYVARIDREPGTDSAAVADGYVAVSLVRLLSDATPASEVAPVQTAPLPPPALDATGLTDEAADYVLEVAAAAAKLAAGAFPVAVKLRPPLAAPAETSSL